MLVALYAVPLAVLFQTVSNQWSIAGFVLGYIVSIGILVMLGITPGRIELLKLPAQLFQLVRYILGLGWDIFLSGFDVARRVLDPRLPINPGEVLVSTQDPKQGVVVAALSAHAITVTPGEMVEDFQIVDGVMHMVVHTLDVEGSSAKIDEEQARRLKLIRSIAGENAS